MCARMCLKISIVFCLSQSRLTFSSFRNQLQSQLLKMEKEVAEFKQFAADDPNMKMKVMITIVRQFGDDVIEAIEGRGTGEIMTDKLSGELVWLKGVEG